MQQSVPQKNALPWHVAAWRGLVKLDFISKFFTWLMEFLARVTEPMATFATIYIIIVAGVPVAMNSHLYILALMLVIGSPELLLVGAFKIASRELTAGNKKAWWLMASCFVLLLLTAITVGDLFIWHWSPGMVNVLMGFRCLAGISYTFTRGICTDHESELNVQPGSQVNTLLEQFTVNLTTSVLETVNQVREQMLMEVSRVNQSTLAEVNRIAQEVNRQQQQLLTTVNGVSQGVHTELSDAIAVLGQQSQQALDAAIERIEHANSRRLEGVYTRLEQVRVTLESSPVMPAVVAASSPLCLPSRVHSQPIQRATSEPESSSPVHSQPVNYEGVNSASEPGDGLLEGTKVNQGHQFAVNHYRQYRVMPPLATIMATVACGKTLASKARLRAAQELGLVVSTTEE